MSASGREIRDLKRYQTVLDRATLPFVLAFVGLQSYRGLTVGTIGGTASMRNLGIALVVLGGLVLYFTPYWRPALFLIGAVFFGTLTVFWGLRTPVSLSFEAIRLLLGVALFVLCITQFFGERLLHERGQERATTEPAPDEGGS